MKYYTITIQKNERPAKSQPSPTKSNQRSVRLAKATKQAKISVIVPVFDTESYLAETLDSVLSQSFEDLELICVNDASRDGSLEILKEAAQSDNRIMIVNNDTNKGVATSINRGLDHASGEYIQVLGSDDLLEGTALETLWETSLQENLDACLYGVEPFVHSKDYSNQLLRDKLEGYREYYAISTRYPAMSGRQLMREMIRNGEYRCSNGPQFVRHRFIGDNKLRLIDGIVHEDNAWTFSMLFYAERTRLMPSKLYLRRLRGSSIVTSKKSHRHLEGLLASAAESLRLVLGETHTSSEELEAFQAVLAGMLMQALGTLRELDSHEKAQIELPQDIAVRMFYALLQQIIEAESVSCSTPTDDTLRKDSSSLLQRALRRIFAQ
jgi:glycosyltransferase involved in cell wall biosynthesis